MQFWLVSVIPSTPLSHECTLILRWARAGLRLIPIVFLWSLGGLTLEPSRVQAQSQPQLNKPANKQNGPPPPVPRAPPTVATKVPKSTNGPQTSARPEAPTKEGASKRVDSDDRKRLRQEIRSSMYGSSALPGDSQGLSPEERAQLRQQIRDHHKTTAAGQNSQPTTGTSVPTPTTTVPVAAPVPTRPPPPVYNRPMEADR
jgi:hypothetical protein